MIVSLHKYNRDRLTRQQKDFLVRLVPIARKIQEWTYFKSSFLNIPCPRGILASITLAEIIYISDWGNHPISRAEYLNKYSNNLSLIPIDNNWKGKSHSYEGVEYKAFRDWEDYAISVSDEYCFSRSYDLPLFCTQHCDQLRALSLRKENYHGHFISLKTLIDDYNLTEFD